MIIARPSRRFHQICRTFTSERSDFLEWEDLEPLSPGTESVSLPANPESEGPEPTQRYYVPPPFTDDQLLQLVPSKVADWPKSRVIWALGRIGFVADLKNQRRDLFQSLASRAAELVGDLNTRDIVRVTQAIAYGPPLEDPGVIVSIRRKLFTSMDQISEPFLISYMYGHLKLVQRLDWKKTENCKRATQFLLSELIHRKSKIDAQRFLEITTVLISESLLKSHSDSIQTILRHAVKDALPHVKSPGALEQFGKALSGIPLDEHFHEINENIEKKFRNKEWKNAHDAMRIGFYFWLNDLISINTCSTWLKAVRSAPSQISPGKILHENLADYHSSIREVRQNAEFHQMKIMTGLLIEKRGFKDLVDTETSDWLEDTSCEISQVDPLVITGCKTVQGLSDPILGSEAPHVTRVIARMAQATLQEGQLGQEVVGPFVLGIANRNAKLCIEWSDQWNLEAPYRRKLAKQFQDLRREYLTSHGWNLILLERKDFCPSPDHHIGHINRLFRDRVTSRSSDLVWRSEVVEPVSAPSKHPLIPQLVNGEQTLTRERRESRSREYRLRSSLVSIRRKFRKKIRKLK